MQIRIAHTFPCTPSEYWDATRAPGVDDEVRREAEVDITELSREDRGGGRTFERTRVSPRKELPAIAQKALGAPKFTYVQEIESDPASLSTTWKVLPDVLPGKVQCSGRSRVVPHAAGCERIIEGEIKVNLPLVGGTVEKHVLDAIMRSYDRAADVIRRHLPRRS